MFVEIFLFFLVLFLYFVYNDRKPANMPPGPFEYPFFGNSYLTHNEEKLNRLRKKYGDVITLRFGSMRQVILFDYEMSKEAMNRPELTGRPTSYSDFNLDDQKKGGVALSNGEQWAHDRRFFIRNLRNLGMGKSYLEVAINDEAQALVDDLLKYGSEEPISYPDSLRTVALNIIWQMVASKRFDLRSEEVAEIYKCTKDFYRTSELALLPSVMPILKKLPKFILHRVFQTYRIDNYLNSLRNRLDEDIDNHEKSFDPNNVNDLIDEYLLGMKNAKEGDTMMRKGALRQIVSDAFDAGSDTINNQLSWMIYIMARFPKVTQKAVEQIDEFVPRDRLVSLDDKPNLSYVEAYLQEALRYSSVVLMNVDRTATEDIEIAGYHIPKGTSVVACIYSAQTDPKYWESPSEFKPERFIDESGKYRAPDKGMLVFGSGRRQCAGETLARMELFLYTSAILQNITVSIPPGEKLVEEAFCDSIGFRLPGHKMFLYTKRN